MDLNDNLKRWPVRRLETRHVDTEAFGAEEREVMGTLFATVVTDSDGEEYTDVSLSVSGPRNAGDFSVLGILMAMSGKKLVEDSENLEEARVQEEFSRLAEATKAGEDGSENARERSVLDIRWRDMSDLDRALALDYVLSLREARGEDSAAPVPGLELTYVDHPILRETEADLTHLHALVLDRAHGLSGLLRDDEIERYGRLIEEHDRDSV